MENATFEAVYRRRFGLAWRWKLAQEGLARALPEVFLRQDKQLRDAADYLALLARGEDGAVVAVHRHPDVHAAQEVWNNTHLQTRVKILVVGGSSVGEIAARLGVNGEVVKTVESLFFDVRGQLLAPDWIVTQVILPEERAGNTDVGTHLRMAYFGGPLIAQTIIRASDRLPVMEADQLYDLAILLYTKAKQALAMPLRSEEGVQKYLAMFLYHQRKTNELNLEREKFRYRCEKELRRQQRTDRPTETVIEESAGLKVA